jgi:hypothetical protein
VCVTCHNNLPHEPAPPPGKTAKAAARKVSGAVADRSPVQVVKAKRVRATQPSSQPGGAKVDDGLPSRFALFLATRPARVVLALCALGLAIYFVYSFVQVVGLLTNLVVVGLLLIVALFFLFRPGPRPAGEEGRRDDSTLARRS